MELWSETEVREALKLSPSSGSFWMASGLSMDSRSAKEGDLFIALKGEICDGHDYLIDAESKGIVAALVERLIPEVTCPQLLVSNTFQALWDLARTRRQQSQALILAITGSVGKTSTKEMLRLVFEGFGETSASQGSYNNHFGVPYTLASLPKEKKYAILELGINHVEEMRPLAELVQPHIALITTVGGAHQGNFNSLQEIRHEKSLIFSGFKNKASLDRGQIAILNRDDLCFEFFSKQAFHFGAQRVLTFGEHPDADIRLIHYAKETQNKGGHIVAWVKDQEVAYTLQLLGQHSAQNSLSVLAAAYAANCDPKKAASFLEKSAPIKGRGKRYALSFQEHSITLIDDSYNANPQSMKAGLKVLAETPVSLEEGERNGRRIAVLGEMLELGEESAISHKRIMEILRGLSIDLVFVTGGHMISCFEELNVSQRGGYALTAEELIPLLQSSLKPGDVIFMKGSFGSQVHKVAEFFVKNFSDS